MRALCPIKVIPTKTKTMGGAPDAALAAALLPAKHEHIPSTSDRRPADHAHFFVSLGGLLSAEPVIQHIALERQQSVLIRRSGCGSQGTMRSQMRNLGDRPASLPMRQFSDKWSPLHHRRAR